MSYLNQKYKHLFLLNWSEAIRTAKLLKSSYHRLSNDFPLSHTDLETESDEFLDKVDAFRVRFSDLQDCIGNKLFRNILKLEDETFISMIDVLNAIEKRSIISDKENWRIVREIRNAFAHDYPETTNEKIETLSLAYTATPILFEVLGNIFNYLQRYELALTTFEWNK